MGADPSRSQELPQPPWVDRLEVLPARALHEVMRHGFAVPAGALDDVEYHGVSLGLPAWVDRVAWKTFKKVFRRDPGRRSLRGWNVAVEQDGSFRDRARRGGRVTYGHYEVRPSGGYADPYGHVQGLVLDYGRGGNAPWDPSGRLRDPVVALEEGSADVLLGYSYVDLGVVGLPTPSFFLLTRGGPLTYDVSPSWRR